MTALLRKDFYVSRQQMGILLGLALLFNLVPSQVTLGNTYAMMIAFMIPMSTVAYDEQCKWDRYAAMLPYKPSTIVWSKYVFCYLGALLGIAVILAGAAVRPLYSQAALSGREIGELIAILLAAVLFLSAFGLPLLFRFGAQKGRLALFIVLGGGAGALIGLNSVRSEIDLPVPMLAALALVLSVGLTALSMRVSLSFYLKRREGVYA